MSIVIGSEYDWRENLLDFEIELTLRPAGIHTIIRNSHSRRWNEYRHWIRIWLKRKAHGLYAEMEFALRPAGIHTIIIPWGTCGSVALIWNEYHHWIRVGLKGKAHGLYAEMELALTLVFLSVVTSPPPNGCRWLHQNAKQSESGHLHNYWLKTAYLLLRVNLDKIVYARWNFDASSARTQRVNYSHIWPNGDVPL